MSDRVTYVRRHAKYLESLTNISRPTAGEQPIRRGTVLLTQGDLVVVRWDDDPGHPRVHFSSNLRPLGEADTLK